jgi:hypothetical protein
MIELLQCACREESALRFLAEDGFERGHRARCTERCCRKAHIRSGGGAEVLHQLGETVAAVRRAAARESVAHLAQLQFQFTAIAPSAAISSRTMGSASMVSSDSSPHRAISKLHQNE